MLFQTCMTCFLKWNVPSFHFAQWKSRVVQKSLTPLTYCIDKKAATFFNIFCVLPKKLKLFWNSVDDKIKLISWRLNYAFKLTL